MESGSYSSAEQLVKDVETAGTKLVAPLLAKEATQPPGSYAKVNPLSLSETRLMTGALALQKMAKSLVTSEQRLKTHLEEQSGANKNVKEEYPKNSGAIEIKLESNDNDSFDSSARSVLTLFGNAQGPKQLFSSLQKPSKAATVLGKRSASELDTSVDVNMPIRDELLPNMISTTKILPIDTGDALSKKRTPTIGELFAAPATLHPLTPPKHAKSTTARAPTITWEYPESRPKTRRGSYNYSREVLSVGQWLGYKGVDQPQEPISPEAKRKQRDRALSTGEAQPKLSEEARLAVEQAKEEALFRSVYSSFAPTRDDSAAVVPTETKDMVWWSRVGEKKFQQNFAVDIQLIDPELMDDDTASGNVTKDDEDAAFREAIETFEPEGPYEDPASKSAPKDDMDELLKEISELLETLNSYQRIRNASLASHSHNRTPSVTSQQATLASMSGSPTSPTKPEVDVYNMLKMQLSILINQLPPHAVAKLNGDQLADLNISKDILIETKNYRGVMEEDQISRLAKAAVLSAAPAPSMPRMNSSSGQYPNSTPQYARPLAGGQLGAARPQANYYPQQQPPNRTPGMPIQRTATGQFATPTAFGGNNPSRPTFTAQSFGQNPPRPGPGPAYGSTSSGGSQHIYPQQSRTPQQFFQNTPQAATQNRNYGQQATGANYQPRPGSHGPAQQAPMYGYPANNTTNSQSSSQSPHARTASPLKTPLPQNQQARPSYPQQPSAPTYGTPPTSTANAAAPATPSGVGPSGFHTSMSSAEQQSMMERQRALLAGQQQQQRASLEQAMGTASPAPGANGQTKQVSGATVGA
ncbi:hypothetical protein NA57DRAFT_65875 [Rhizodiscina lignyota]|uniref:DUF7785 domain-containing protein n=1 Tax=Rhizodiscina lignyota TaxID=1504668 RepID=A0A9P4IIY1_9PEZI|nr:hypothetical protein NA57DRAFT_65875 [Rhizodiscina lignyota]